MGQILHGSATTTEAVRRAIQYSQESLRVLAKRLRSLEDENAKLKRLLADAMLDNTALKVLLTKMGRPPFSGKRSLISGLAIG